MPEKATNTEPPPPYMPCQSCKELRVRLSKATGAGPAKTMEY